MVGPIVEVGCECLNDVFYFVHLQHDQDPVANEERERAHLCLDICIDICIDVCASPVWKCVSTGMCMDMRGQQVERSRTHICIGCA